MSYYYFTLKENNSEIKACYFIVNTVFNYKVKLYNTIFLLMSNTNFIYVNNSICFKNKTTFFEIDVIMR